MKKLGLIALVLLILAGAAAFIVYKYVYNKPHTDYAKAKADLSVNARQLWTDYSTNKDIADKKYTGKVLEIDGNILRVETVEDMVIVVFAYREGDFGDEGIRVTMLPAYHQAAKGIDPLKNVKIKGICTGYNDTDVIMESGSIVGNQ